MILVNSFKNWHLLTVLLICPSSPQWFLYSFKEHAYIYSSPLITKYKYNQWHSYLAYNLVLVYVIFYIYYNDTYYGVLWMVILYYYRYLTLKWIKPRSKNS